MKGLVVKYGEKTYKVGLPDGGVTLSSCIMQNKFTLEAGGSGHAYASVFLKLREDIEFEVEVAVNLIKLPSLFLKRINR